MFDIGAMELLVIVIVAVIVIGPKDMPMAMRTAGRWIGKVRRVSSHFRTGVDAMVREAELEDMEKQWKARNEEIMRKHPNVPVSETAGASASANAQSPSANADAHTTAAMTGPITGPMTGPPGLPDNEETGDGSGNAASSSDASSAAKPEG